MFLVFDKSQISAYLISIGTVICLFFMTCVITKSPETVQTTANNVNITNGFKENNIDKIPETF